MPKVKAVKLAAGVNSAACSGGKSVTTLASFPITSGGGQGNWGQHSTGNLGVTITGDDTSGYNFVINNKNHNGWYRGAYGKWKVTQADLPVKLSWDWGGGGHTSASGNHALEFMGFNYVANDKQKAWYDCIGDFFLRCQPNEGVYEYRKGCATKDLKSSHGQNCDCGTSGKLEITIAKDGTVKYFRNGNSCGTSQTKATQFPMYVQSSQYGAAGTLSNIKLTKE